MKNTISQTVEVNQVNESKIGQVDFENLDFGKIFTDHMFVCDYKNGSWQTPKIIPYGPLTMEPSARVFHYGQAVFEGMKAYKDDNGDTFLFRPDENFKRINKSSERLAIPEFPEEYFFDGLNTLLKLDNAWIKSGSGNSLYIRPFVIATQASVSASEADEYKFLIICSPAQSYYSGDVSVLVAEKFSRSASGGFGYAKAAGNYAGQFYPTKLAKEQGYQQVIWTDSNTHEYMEEAGTMNVFFRINDTLLTAPVSDRILDGITRKSLISIAEKEGYKVDVRPVKVSEIVAAAKDGSLKEVFGAGTAAVVSPVKSFGYKGEHYEIEKQENSYASYFKKVLMDIQYNKVEDPFGWRYKV
ncbi:branched-chain amino acid aminotransferase [Aquimarina sp. AD10]|uniref:Branched-chain-amino-acid aminotransferase n=1 Tax=Aquimarina aggregata TaxID=1642818 RepID=A0A163AAP8_9FLAO|nr:MULTISPECIES: branched-chain amino acid aminotransferase [Aquimarina]AXT63271.1 branched-chain amino acid aminotransferase [Aquimarina sp. AD10]KZS40398.1 branched chain amino acid aminotransferase [Aquimarina aggregata]RKN00715.1 branched-chain amino acid aminotransferase [Aquimarina sp. AD10]